MIVFTSQEIAFSLLCAVIFGVLFSVICSLMTVLFSLLKKIRTFPHDIIKYDKISSVTVSKTPSSAKKTSLAGKIFGIILFTVGFVLLSYLCLDGTIRVYMIFLSIASFYLSKVAFFDFLQKALIVLTDILYRYVVVIFRVFLYPLSFIFRKICVKFQKILTR